MGNTLWSAAADLLLGACCAGCSRPGQRLCRSCRGELVAAPRRCWPDPPPPTMVAADVPPYAAAEYADVVRRLVVAYKDEGRADLAEPFGRMLAVAVERVLEGRHPRVELVPVPSSPASVRRRGRDVVADLARAAARLLRRRGITVSTVRCLAHRRTVLDQAGLTSRQRADNLRGALRVASSRRSPDPAVFRVVVDDVLTTGATADEAVRALLAVGLPVHAVVTVAATRRHPRSAPFPGSGRGG